jgi:D-aminoacyl-tRNA deacylase
MRIVIQRVTYANVCINDTIKSEIKLGLLILLGIEDSDSELDADWLCQKISGIRIFNDTEGKMNLSPTNVNAEIMLVSQFTLFASTLKGNRPSFIKAARPDKAIPLYEYFIKTLETLFQKPIATGVFGADMQINLKNDGPVTIIIDSKMRE